MLTLYSVVKAFTDPHIATIQRNAIRSWQTVLPDAEIILFGADEPGAVWEAAALGVPILPMRYNENGAPLVADVIECANRAARYDVRCLINADILLEPTFRPAVQIVSDTFGAFLFIMRRFNVQVDEPIDFDGDWHKQISELDSKAYTVCGSDVFCYRGDWLRDVPAFGMGRTSWDNWIIERAGRENVPIVDGTNYTRAFHQEHAKHKPKIEARANQALLRKAFGRIGVGSLNRAQYRLTDKGEIAG